MHSYQLHADSDLSYFRSHPTRSQRNTTSRTSLGQKLIVTKSEQLDIDNMNKLQHTTQKLKPNNSIFIKMSSLSNEDFRGNDDNKRKRANDDEMDGDNNGVSQVPVIKSVEVISSAENGTEGNKLSASIAASTDTAFNIDHYEHLQPLLEADGVLVTILAFLPTAKVCRLRSVDKRWKRLGEIAIQNQTKKSFGSNEELRQAVCSYCETDVYGSFEPDASDKYRVKCVYGHVIGDWDVSKVRDFSWVFFNMVHFNEPIENWDVSNATTLANMFCYAFEFNQSLNGWNTSNVKTMSWMFSHAMSFNQDLSGWNTSKVTTMVGTFSRATKFTQTPNAWGTLNSWGWDTSSLRHRFDQSQIF